MQLFSKIILKSKMTITDEMTKHKRKYSEIYIKNIFPLLIILIVWLAAVVTVVGKLNKYEHVTKYVPIFLPSVCYTGEVLSSRNSVAYGIYLYPYHLTLSFSVKIFDDINSLAKLIHKSPPAVSRARLRFILEVNT